MARARFIYGSCIAFEPYSFDPARQYLAPYVYWKGDAPEFVQLGNPTYDYFKWEWYAAAKTAGRARWCEPYFDEGGGETIMTTYSVPFRRAGQFWGIATIDIAMSDLTEDVSRIHVGEKGYAFVLSKEGKFLAFPDRAQIMKGSLFDSDRALAASMTAGMDGFVRAKEPWRGQDAWIALVPIRTGELSLGVVYPAGEIAAKAAALQTDLITIGAIGLIALVAMVAIIARSFSRPISALAQAARRVAAGDLDVPIDARASTREMSVLAGAFGKMTADLKSRIEALKLATAAHERIEGELAAARSIQASILPAHFPVFPGRKDSICTRWCGRRAKWAEISTISFLSMPSGSAS